MGNGKIPFISMLGFCLAIVLGTLSGGCSNQKPVTQAPVSEAAPETRTGGTASDDAAKAFLTTLEALTFDQRMKYVNEHQAESYQVTQSKDPAITTKYSRLMTPPQRSPAPAPAK